MTLIIGVDPGVTTGICALRYKDGLPTIVGIMSCNAEMALPLANFLHTREPTEDEPVLLALERFVVGRASMRAGTDGQITRHLIGRFLEWARMRHVRTVERSAAEVKVWAMDGRLSAAGLLAPTRKMPDARDATRHALFAAVKDCGVRDPLSRRAGAR